MGNGRGIFWCVLAGFIAFSSGSIPAQPPRVVDDAALLKAAPEEWLTAGHDLFETHYSPLKLIHSGNVSRLGLAWTYDIGSSSGHLEATPLISDGVLYGTGTWSTVYALDARTGRLIWKWDPVIVRSGEYKPSVCCGPVNRGVALYQGKLYVGLLDGRLVALDAKTGQGRWAVQTTPTEQQYSMTAQPRIYRGKVIVGNSGSEFGIRGYTSAYDAETGKLLWRTYHVPGDPSKPFESKAMEFAAKTWDPQTEWWKTGGGGSNWDSYSYDPEADLIYVGTGQGTPWNSESRTPKYGDSLYICSILALRGATGEQVWYYQTTPGDSWDYDSTMPMLLTDLTIDGRQRKVLMQAPKNGFFYVLDRLTGELISAEPFAKVTWAKGIDKKTGRPIESDESRYRSKGLTVSPGMAGGGNWNAPSWNPDTRLVYIPGQETSSYYARQENYKYQKGQYNLGVSMRPPAGEAQPAPLSEGFLVAWDPVAQKQRWRVIIPKNILNGGTLSTAGNLVFSGVASGLFRAHSADKGEQLWETKIGSGLGTPVTYELDGKQYVTIVAGAGTATNPGRVWTFVLDGKATPPPAGTPAP
jgi:quinohemoprotein ethanol dehydrogenase